MKVSWLTPFKTQPELAAGCVVEVETDYNAVPEYIPMPLEPELIDDIMKRGPVWLVEQLPDAFPTFATLRNAEIALFEMFEMHQRGMMTIGAMYDLVEELNGTWRDKSEYDYELGAKPTKRH